MWINKHSVTQKYEEDNTMYNAPHYTISLDDGNKTKREKDMVSYTE